MVLRALAAGLLALTLAGCGGGDEPEREVPPTGSAELRDVSNVLELRAAFNEDAGRPRLLILLSPT